MAEIPKRTRLGVFVLAGAGALALVFGAGVLVGRAIPERSAPEAETSPDPVADPELLGKLQVCRQKAVALADDMAQAAPPKEAVLAKDAGQEIPATKATVEELEVERKRCRKSELLINAEVCVAAARQFNALTALPQDGLVCGPKSRSADLVEVNFESCAVFGGNQADIGSDDFTKEESSLIADAIRVHQTLTEDELLRRLKDFVSACTETRPQYPPGVNRDRRPKGRRDERTPQKP